MSTYIVRESTMHRAVYTISKQAEVCLGLSTRPTENLDEIGRRLFALNATATREDAPHHYRWNPVGICVPTVGLRALDCLVYQCAEPSTVETKEFREIEALANAMAARLFRQSDAYVTTQEG